MQDESSEIDDGFGHWLAGFADGEGCFHITCLKSGGRYGYNVRFQISLRADDRAILDEIQRRTGLGTVVYHRATESSDRVGHPWVVWGVWSREHNLRLMSIFDRYPLRAKKAADYVIWREALVEWTSISYDPRRNRGPNRDWSRMAVLKAQLMEGRKYDGKCETRPPALIDPQLALLEG